ncbi:MAG: MTH1187 family thiamine-binding protein [Eubacteriales bacterium]
MAIVAVNMVPLGMGSSVSKYVAAAEKVIVNRPGIKRELGPMFTSLEGDLDEIMQAIREMQEAVFETGVDRVITTIKIDDRRDKKSTMEGKLDSVKAKIEGRA